MGKTLRARRAVWVRQMLTVVQYRRKGQSSHTVYTDVISLADKTHRSVPISHSYVRTTFFGRHTHISGLCRPDA